ncbi:MAG: glycoside hydrolase family 27 protein [Bifidobacteriaceae bacterium]|jgi:alpha-galactosidase|nr:glycoside hydrolase family 27 protein [Bifidobacteriaceae bacterium]MCI1979463.1 glycoside hydrolase family 27 protein [Bifidobacteriaceae bacterium]
MATTYDPTNSLASAPPLGWNSYNPFGGQHGLPDDWDRSLPGKVALSEKLILETADAIVDSGLRDAGYRYVNIDDRWQDPRQPRGEDGLLRPDPRRFPHGMKFIGDQLHDRGLKFGIYAVANVYACGGEEGSGPQGLPATGSLGREPEDAGLFAEWGVDFLKVDWCGTDLAKNHGRAEEIFGMWDMAIKDSGRGIVLSASTYGEENEENWAPRLTHMWRTTPDLHATWESILSIAHATSSPRFSSLAGTDAGWNDPDMLHVGHKNLTFEESQTHLALWAMMRAPLLLGNDVRRMSPELRDLLMNPVVLRIDQDVVGEASFKTEGEWELWSRTLSDGKTAHLAVNLSSRSLDLPNGHFLDNELIALGNPEQAVPAHGCVLSIE